MFHWEDQVGEAKLPGTALRIAGALRKRCGHDDVTKPIEQKWLAKQLGVHPRTVQRGLNALEAADLIQQIGDERTGRASRYRLLVCETENAQPLSYGKNTVGGTAIPPEGVRQFCRTKYSDPYSSSNSERGETAKVEACSLSEGENGFGGEEPEAAAAIEVLVPAKPSGVPMAAEEVTILPPASDLGVSACLTAAAIEGDILPPQASWQIEARDWARLHRRDLGAHDVEVALEKLADWCAEKGRRPEFCWRKWLRDERARKRTVIDAANDLIANLDAQIAAAEAREAAGLGMPMGEADAVSPAMTVVRGTEEWHRRVSAGHPDTLFTTANGRECWHFHRGWNLTHPGYVPAESREAA